MLLGLAAKIAIFSGTCQFGISQAFGVEEATVLTIAKRMRASLWETAMTAAMVPSMDFSLHNHSLKSDFQGSA